MAGLLDASAEPSCRAFDLERLMPKNQAPQKPNQPYSNEVAILYDMNATSHTAVGRFLTDLLSSAHRLSNSLVHAVATKLSTRATPSNY
jgi:hypothetical protein